MASADGPNDEGAYPPSWVTDVVLSDGRTVQVRPITPDDADRLRAFHAKQSPESIYFRYFSPRPVLSDRDVDHFTHVDHHSRVAFVAVSEDEIIAVARYERYQGSDVAEVAFFVDDDHHGRGLATLLLEYLAAAGRERGISRFTATTLPNNAKMIAVFSGAGYEVTTNFDYGVIEVGFDIQPTDRSMAAVDRRERRAEAASVRHLLMPSSIAVVGAGRSRGTIGAEIYANLLAGGFTGPIHPVNRSGETIDGRPALRSIADLPEGTDLAVIATPAADVASDVARCGERGVKALVIVSAGFSESGPDGRVLEGHILEVARGHGMRVLGPNCLGILNTDPDVLMDASISALMPPAGRVAVFAETGTLAAAMVEHAARRAMGISAFVAAGNRLDVTASDFLSYWAEDDRTDAVLLSLTGQDLVPRFVRAARATSLVKPVAALNAAGPVLGYRSAGDASARRAKAMFRQTGVIGVGSLQALFDIGRVLAEQPVPRGARVAVVGNSDGALVLAANACRGAGLDTGDPIDLTFRATSEDFARVMESIASKGSVDSLLVVYTPPTLEPDERVNAAIMDVSTRYPDLTVVATMFGTQGRSVLHGGGSAGGVPVFTFPEDAAHALGHLAGYRSWLNSAEEAPSTDLEATALERARAVVAQVVQRSGNQSAAGLVPLDLAEQQDMLAAVDIAIAERRVVLDVDSAVAAGDELGWPVVLKAAVRDRTTRSAASGVTLDVGDATHLRLAWERMTVSIGTRMVPAVVQRFVPNGIDLSVEIHREASGAGTVAVGLGGPAGIVGDRELGVIPLGLADASSLVAASPVGRALTDPLDRVAFVAVVHRLASLAESLDVELRIAADPVIADGPGVWLADVDIAIGPPIGDFLVRRIDGPPYH